MTTLHLAEPVTVWCASGIPARLVWRGRRFRVTDTPTPIRDSVTSEGLTHPIDRLVGWRFQGTSDDDDTHVFDVEATGFDSWRLTAYYD